MHYKSILKTLHFWRDAPLNEIYKSATFKVSFKKLTTEPMGLVIKIYRFLGIKMGAKYKNALIGEVQKTKVYKSEHKYSSTDIDLG